MSKAKKPNEPTYTAIKMDEPLYKMARRQAKKLRQSYSGYVRQLILDDLAAGKAAAK